jgi:hypothetical protein
MAAVPTRNVSLELAQLMSTSLMALSLTLNANPSLDLLSIARLMS